MVRSKVGKIRTWDMGPSKYVDIGTCPHRIHRRRGMGPLSGLGLLMLTVVGIGSWWD